MKKSRIPTTALSFCQAILFSAGWCILPGCMSKHTTAGFDFENNRTSPAADGIYVSHLRLHVTPSDVEEYEALMRRCTAAAHSAELPESHEWLCYRATPCRYDIIRFSDTIDGFATPHDFRAFIRAIARAASLVALEDINQRLAVIEFQIEWQFLSQQYSAWSTVESITTATHPKARVTEYTVKDKAMARFNRALSARTDFLRKTGYALPIEGFVVLSQPPARAWQVVFPVSWEQYHRSDSLRAFTNRLSPTDQRELQRLDRSLAKTVSSVEQYDVDHAPELRYSVPE